MAIEIEPTSDPRPPALTKGFGVEKRVASEKGYFDWLVGERLASKKVVSQLQFCEPLVGRFRVFRSDHGRQP